MTTEEAIELLENLKVCRQAHLLFNIEKEAVDMAIEALKENESLAKTVNEASDLLRKKRPHGEWLDTGYGTSRCSVCGEKCQTYSMDKPRDRFCSNVIDDSPIGGFHGD